MRIYRDKPSVWLISRPEVIWENIYSVLEYIKPWIRDPHWVWTTPSAGEQLAEFGGRICYKSFGALQGRKDSKEYLDNILKLKHLSVLEHAQYVFCVAGSRNFTHEQVRHRHFGYSQESTRYVDYSENIAFYRGDISERTLETIWEEYRRNLETQISGDVKRKVATTAARKVLPGCLEAMIVISGNVRCWYEYLGKRISPAADPEINYIASEIKRLLAIECPIIFGEKNEA